MRASRSPGTIGIGHTRWATHGRPTENNAHPHATEQLAVVHNGIIENFSELRRELEGKGAKFATETDTEVIAHLVTEEMKRGASPVDAVKAALPRLRGAFALAFLFAGEDDLLIGARRARRSRSATATARCMSAPMRLRWRRSPTRSAISKTATGWSSPRSGAEIHDASGDGRAPRGAEIASLGHADRQGQSSPFHGQGNSRAAGSRRPHARAITSTWRPSASRCRCSCRSISSTLERISIAACGTAYYAGMVASYWFERFAQSAGRGRYRLGIPLPRGAARARRSRDLRVAVGRDRRHAGVAALCARAQAARALGRQRADLDHRARKRHRDADAGRTGNRRRLDQGLHLPAGGAGGAGDRGRPRARRA